jgi:2-oxo-4-hydroxy-4-carboxy-5-ureidoimidazoline decarboxylase
MECSGLKEKLQLLNELPKVLLRKELLRCCGSTGWVEGMISQFPFSSCEQLFDVARVTWWNLPVTEWKMAFSAHPQIGMEHPSSLGCSLIHKFCWL